MARFRSSTAPGSYSTDVTEAVEPIAVTWALPRRTPDAATICPRQGVMSARSGPAPSDTSKLSQWTTVLLIAPAASAYGAAYFFPDAYGRSKAGRARGSPCSGVRHADPRFGGRQRLSLLQQLDGDAVGRADKGHAPVARRPVDDDAFVHQPPTGRIDIVDAKRQMTEVAAARIFVFVPVVGELDHRRVIGERPRLVLGRGQIDQGISSLFAVHAANFLQPELVTVEVEAAVQIADPNHRMQIPHARRPSQTSQTALQCRQLRPGGKLGRSYRCARPIPISLSALDAIAPARRVPAGESRTTRRQNL